jgi:hypothetical protein
MIQAEDTGGEEVPSGQLSSSPQVTDEPHMHSNAQSVMNQRHCGSSSHAARPSPPLVNDSQMIQAEDTGGEEVPSGQLSSSPQVTDEPNMHSNAQSVMNQRHCGSASHAASRPYQPLGGISARTEADSLGASLVLSLDTQLPTGSTSEQFLAEDGFESNPFTIELSRLQKLHDLIAKRHREKVYYCSPTSVFCLISATPYFGVTHQSPLLFRQREQLILARQVEIAQAKKKYEELVYNSEVEVLQRRRELKITSDKIYKQQILAEVLQVLFKASAKVVPESPRGIFFSYMLTLLYQDAVTTLTLI